MEKLQLRQRYYIYDGKKIPLYESETQKVVKISKNIDKLPIYLKKLIGSYYLIQGQDFIEDPIIKKLPKYPVLENPDNPLKNKEVLIPNEQIIVKLKDKSYLDSVIKKYGLNSSNIKEMGKNTNTFILSVPRNKESLDIANEIAIDKELGVEFAQPNFIRIFEAFDIATSPVSRNATQWYLNGTNGINAVGAWNITTGNPNIVIAIIDEGVDFNHPDLINKKHSAFVTVTGNTNPDPEDNHIHGTLCAGVAAAKSSNGQGINGVAPDCKIMSVKVALRDPGNPRSWILIESDVVNGINTAVNNGAHILNCSWGMNFPSNVIQNALNNAKLNGRNNKGCILCCSTGNNGASVMAFPSTIPATLAIGATKKSDGKKASFSNWDSIAINVDLCAPGVEIKTTSFSGHVPSRIYDYANVEGTSFSSPQVAGAAALVLSKDPNMTADNVYDKIKNTSFDIDPLNPDILTGKGRLDVLKALQ